MATTDRDKTRERMQLIAAEIWRHNDLYYNEGKTEITDAEYDELVRELRRLEAEHPDLAVPDSPTDAVGARLPGQRGFAQVEHLVPMLSLESLTSDDEVREFDERVRKALEIEDGVAVGYVLEPKYDGVSASLLYEGGQLTRGLTRGDGRVGEEITRNLRKVRGVPQQLDLGAGPPPARIEVRGEVILGKTRFAQIRAEQEKASASPFRNARNAVAGALKRIDPTGLEDLGMELIVWGVGDVRGLDDVKTYSELAQRLSSFGFTISPELATLGDVNAAITYHDELEAKREDLEYEMDGVVAKVDDLARQRSLGRTARAPRWAWAHKFAPRRAWTKLEEIRVQVGRTGAITPVAVLAPVELAGVTVQRASLHNFGLLVERDIRPGDRVEIERAGDVIPEVVRVDLDARAADSAAYEPPADCPVCGEEATKEGAFLYCTNIDCPAQIRERVVHLASRRALDIDRLGDKYVDQLFEAGLVRNVEDVFGLPEREEDVLALERWGPQSFDNLRREIERAKRPVLPRFLYALGIRHVGEKVSADLADAFGSFEAVRSATVEQLVEVDGVGPKVAEEVVRFFELPANRRFLDTLAAAGVEVQSLEREADGEDAPLAGRVFVFTGSLQSLSRDQARERAQSLGAATASGISKRVTDVVAGPGAGSKLDKAEKLGLSVLTEEQFLALLAEHGVTAT